MTGGPRSPQVPLLIYSNAPPPTKQDLCRLWRNRTGWANSCSRWSGRTFCSEEHAAVGHLKHGSETEELSFYDLSLISLNLSSPSSGYHILNQKGKSQLFQRSTFFIPVQHSSAQHDSNASSLSKEAQGPHSGEEAWFFSPVIRATPFLGAITGKQWLYTNTESHGE